MLIDLISNSYLFLIQRKNFQQDLNQIYASVLYIQDLCNTLNNLQLRSYFIYLDYILSVEVYLIDRPQLSLHGGAKPTAAPVQVSQQNVPILFLVVKDFKTTGNQETNIDFPPFYHTD